MTVNEKAEALVELGMVRLTKLDTMFRVVACQVAARNLDVATVEYTRGKGSVYVARCEHRSPEGGTHTCEGHQNGHVCYHSRAGLMFAARLAGKVLTFHKTEAEAKAQGQATKVMVAGAEGKAIWGAIK